MADLIDDLLELSRISRSEMRHDLVDLSLMAKQVIGALKDASPERRVEFSVQPNEGLNAGAIAGFESRRIVVGPQLLQGIPKTSPPSRTKLASGRVPVSVPSVTQSSTFCSGFSE